MSRTASSAMFFVLAAICLPIIAGLAWHQSSDNPIWPLVRNTPNLCQLSEAQLSPATPDGSYQAHVVHATCFGRFDETMVFVTGTADSWSLETLNANRAILEVAGVRTLDAITWQGTSSSPVLQLWLTPGAEQHQVHRIERSLGAVVVQTQTSTPPPGAERLDY